jgi:hypothetical protein
MEDTTKGLKSYTKTKGLDQHPIVIIVGILLFVALVALIAK